MRNINLLVIFFTILTPHALPAQTIKLVNSTDQGWSGGVAGRTGNNYTFSIEFSGFKPDPIPDTIWIGQTPVQLSITDSGDTQANTKRTKKKSSIKFNISAGTSEDEYADRYPTPDNMRKEVPSHCPITYKGVALLSYKYKGKKHYYVISRIMTTYPPADYP